MNPLIGVVLDLVVIGLLSATILSVWGLSGKLKAFRDSRRDFEAMVHKFDAAMGRADIGLKSLDEASKRAGEDLQTELSRARALRDELRMMTETAEALARRLENSAPASTKTTEPPRSDVRSKAERDLQKAMEGKRPL